MQAPSAPSGVSLSEVALQWGRLGCIGFGGPPAHIALLRDLCVSRRAWMDDEQFEDAVAACNLLPGPASTKLSILCAWTVAGPVGAIVGGLAFILPGLAVIIGLSALFLAASPPLWVLGAGAGAGSAVAAVALHSAISLVPTSWSRSIARWRWILYAVTGACAGAFAGPWIVVVLLACGGAEFVLRHRPTAAVAVGVWPLVAKFGGVATVAGTTALAWVALKVGALSYGGGFVIIPLMRHDAVHTYQWMTDAQFLDAVALGQITPGPVVLTVAVVGFAAAGVFGAVLAAAVAFTPSFLFVLVGGRHFEALRRSPSAQAFLGGSGPAAIGAIAGIALPLASALDHAWQFGTLAAAGLALFVARRRAVTALVLAAIVGVIAVESGAPLG